MGNKTHSKSKTKSKLTTPYSRRTRQICNVRKLATECHKLDSRLRLPLNPDRERSRGEVTSQSPPYTSLLRVGNLARADCTQDAQKSTARSSPHCAHPLPHNGREGRFQHPTTFFPSYQRQRQKSPKLIASPFNRHRWHTLGHSLQVNGIIHVLIIGE